MKQILLFLLVVGVVFAAPVKKVGPAEIQKVVQSAIPGWLAKNPVAENNTGKPSKLISVTVTSCDPVPGWTDTWRVSGKVKLSSGSRSFDARVSTKDGIKVTDISLGF